MTEKEITRLGIERLLANGTFEAAYPLHEVLNNISENRDESYKFTICYSLLKSITIRILI